MPAVFEAQNINKKIGDQMILQEMSFSIQSGQCFGLLGPDGAGKSTALKLIYGQIQPSEGEIFVLGLNTKSSIEMIKRKIGILPQTNGLDAELNVYDNLLTTAWYFDLSKKFSQERIEYLLNEFRLNSYRDYFLPNLSPSLQKKLALAKALLHEPEFLILDEPSHNLNPQTKQWMWNFIKSFKASGKSILLVTKDVEEATELCDQVAILNQGEILSVGQPEKLVYENLGSYLVEFQVKTEELPYFANKFKSLGKVLYQHNNYIVIGFQTEAEAKSFSSQINSDHFSVRKPLMKDLFVQLTGHEITSAYLARGET